LIGLEIILQVAIGVKIFRQKVDGSRRIVGLLYHAAIEIEFGISIWKRFAQAEKICAND
jgi:hypothetical protein